MSLFPQLDRKLFDYGYMLYLFCTCEEPIWEHQKPPVNTEGRALSWGVSGMICYLNYYSQHMNIEPLEHRLIWGALKPYLCHRLDVYIERGRKKNRAMVLHSRAQEFRTKDRCHKL